jgi:hypothetical protein
VSFPRRPAQRGPVVRREYVVDGEREIRKRGSPQLQYLLVAFTARTLARYGVGPATMSLLPPVVALGSSGAVTAIERAE